MIAAFFGNADQSLQMLDTGDNGPFDLDQVTMTAWVMPTAHTIAPGSLGYAAEMIIMNKEVRILYHSTNALLWALAFGFERSSLTSNRCCINHICRAPGRLV